MKDQTTARRLRFLVSTLVLVLVFEGLLRKMVGGGFKVAVFFAKDFVVLLMGILVMNMPKPAPIQALWKGYVGLMFLFVPVAIVTYINDPLLAVFGAERYLLMPMVAFGVYGAFEDAEMELMLSYVRKLGLLLIPITLLALVQLRLPVNHWLNLAVSGESLEGFRAGESETLRVASTFPFVSQFTMYLNAQVFVCAIALSGFTRMTTRRKIVYATLPFALLLSSYATGSRGAVIGNAVIAGIALMLAAAKGQGGGLVKLSVIVMALYLSFFTLKALFPQAFVVYGEREEGHFLSLSSENQERTRGMFTDLVTKEAPASLFGYGLGVMSNGSEKLSSYAYTWRRGGFWTETDYSTTLFEGGIYLMLVWYGFRLWVIAHTTRRILRGIKGDYAIPAVFCQGFIILEGAMGTLGMQPPLAIWWWLAVGLVMLFWQKSTAVAGTGDVILAELEGGAAVTRPKIRGRSVYAEQLHKSARK